MATNRDATLEAWSPSDDADAYLQLEAYLEEYYGGSEYDLEGDADGDRIATVRTDDERLHCELQGAGFVVERDGEAIVVRGATLDLSYREWQGGDSE